LSIDITGVEIILFLDILSNRIPKMMLLWDNASIHRSVEVKEYLYIARHRIEMRSFPVYAPELNHDEYIFSYACANGITTSNKREVIKLVKKCSMNRNRLQPIENWLDYRCESFYEPILK
jgi:transposase